MESKINNLLNFAQITDFIRQDESVEPVVETKNELDCLHHRNLTNIETCNCTRCAAIRYNAMAVDLVRQYGRELTDLERQQAWAQAAQRRLPQAPPQPQRNYVNDDWDDPIDIR